MISNNNGKARLLINEGKPKNNWIGIELEGRSCNRQAIGSKITISTESGNQAKVVNPAGSYLTSNDIRVVFGIYNDQLVRSMTVDWPGSGQEVFNELEPNQYYKIIQGTSITAISTDL